MDQDYILSVLSDDRPGVVKLLAQQLAQHQGNWQESRLTQLAGKFAGVVRVRLPEEHAEAFQAALAALKPQGIRVQMEPLKTHSALAPERTATFSAAGPDRPGIVLEIAQAFTQYNINVTDLNTQCSSMPYSGEPLFEADGVLSLPQGTDLEQLIEQLDAIADELGMDIALEETDF